MARVEEARASLGITRSQQYPNFGASSAVEINRLSRDGTTPLPAVILPSQNRNFGTATLNLLSFEVDIWGRLRRATEAARANLLSAEENRKAVVTTLVSDVATSYLSLRELDYELEISRRTLETREESLDLTKSRQSGGVSTLLDLRQAEQLVDTAAQAIPGIEQQIEQTENQIHLLLGENPGEVTRGSILTAQDLPPEVPAGLPSDLLERRPDIRAAEQALIAANAQIGVARAAYFPQLSLSGFLGGQSTQLASLLNGPHSAWSLVPQVSQPIFTGWDVWKSNRQAGGGRSGNDGHWRNTKRPSKPLSPKCPTASSHTRGSGKAARSRRRWFSLYKTGCVWPTCGIVGAWIRSSTLSTPIAICFRRN